MDVRPRKAAPVQSAWILVDNVADSAVRSVAALALGQVEVELYVSCSQV